MHLNDGVFKGEQLIPEWWVNYCADTTNQFGKYNYCNGFWGDIDQAHQRAYYAAGFNGQYIYINKKKGIVIVRVGEKKGGINWFKSIDKLAKLL